MGNDGVGVPPHRLPRVGIDVKTGKVAAGDVEPDAVAGGKEIAGGGQGDGNGRYGVVACQEG